MSVSHRPHEAGPSLPTVKNRDKSDVLRVSKPFLTYRDFRTALPLAYREPGNIFRQTTGNRGRFEANGFAALVMSLGALPSNVPGLGFESHALGFANQGRRSDL